MIRTLYAALVSIDAYQRPVPALHGCANDIDAVALLLEAFSKTSGFTLAPRILKDSDATRANIIDAFRTHLGQAGPDDVALFYYSGHGSQERAPPEFWHIEPDHLNETLVCFDSRNDDSWDLADKELAVLIAEVAAHKPHLVCVLDCCHSGSGTRASLEEGLAIRRAPTDQRPRPLDSFLDGALTAKGDQDKASSDTNWIVMPAGRHVLLAACRSSETAKEVNENGRTHGAFTAALLAALQQSRGAISYRDLVKRAESQVRLRVAQQVPQIEASEQTDLLQLFLGGAVEMAHGTFTLSFDRGLGWVVDGGAIHAVAGPQGKETTIFAVFPLASNPSDWKSLDAAVGLAEVREVRPELSCVHIKPSNGALDNDLTYRAIVVATPLPPKQAYFVGDAAALASLRQALGNAKGPGNASLLVRETATEETSDFRVVASPSSYRISRASAERPLVAEIEGIGERGAQLVLARLEHVARWQAVAALRNDDTRLGDTPVKLTMRLPVQAGRATTWEEIDPRREARLSYSRAADGKWRKPQFRLTLTNSSDVDLYCALLWLGESYSIKSLFPAGAYLIPKHSEMAANEGKAFYASIPDDKWKAGRTELTDQIKLIVSREQFDPTLFDQGAIDTYTRARGAIVRPRSMLERLASRVHTRDVETEPDDDEMLGDWTTSDLTLTVVRPREAAEVPPDGAEAELGAGVTLIGHPSFKAQASLVSVTEVGRALGALGTPAIFRDDPALSQPFLFETARGTDPGLGALQLTDIKDAETVTSATPLRLRVAASLGPDEHVIPYAWDGEFYLPLGTGRPAGGAVEIELRQIPVFSTASDVERGVISSIRIMFQKIVSPYLPVEFDYPRLAAVTFDAEGNPVYNHAAAHVRDKVATASRILLYVHGILGDTRGMTAAAIADVMLPGSPATRVADRYDLLLAFDYENINTAIKDTARDLKQRLAAVGLSADHGKTLHVAAHSMGGLVSRWFIEQEGGNRVVQHLVTLGTPHAGSPWPTIENWATAALAIGLNGLSQVAWPLKLLGDLAGAVEKIDVALDEMAPNSAFMKDLARGGDPKVPCTLLIGNTSIIPAAIANGRLQALLTKLAPQRVLHDVASLAFLNKPNDIAVAVSSAQAVPQPRVPAPTTSEVACDHITFFTTEVGRKALLTALQGA